MLRVDHENAWLRIQCAWNAIKLGRIFVIAIIPRVFISVSSCFNDQKQFAYDVV